MKRIIVVAGIAALLVTGSAVMAAAALADVDRPDAGGASTPVMQTAFGPVVSHERTLRGTVVAYSLPGAERDGAWVIQLRTIHNRRVAHARVRVVASMPEDSSEPDRHGVARYVGNGRYEVSGVGIDRAGWWNVGLSVERRGRTDSLAFNLLLADGRASSETP